MTCSARRAEALRAHVQAGGPEGEIAARVLKAMGLPLEGEPDVDLKISVNGAYDRDLAVAVARLCGVTVMGLPGEKRRFWLRGPRALAEPAVDMYRAERKAMHRRRQLSDIAFINKRYGHIFSESDGGGAELSQDEIDAIVGMSLDVERAGKPRKRLGVDP